MNAQSARRVDQRTTADEFGELAGTLGSVELIDGEIVSMPPTGIEHGVVEVELAAALRAHLLNRGRGIVASGEVGYKLSEHSVRAADVAVHLDRPAVSAGFISTVPDLVAEIVSPSDTWPSLERKAMEWLAAGVKEVWLVEPQTGTVSVRHGDGTARIFRSDATIESVVLPSVGLRPVDLFKCLAPLRDQ